MYGIFPYIYHKNQPNVGKYTVRLMDPMGNRFTSFDSGPATFCLSPEPNMNPQNANIGGATWIPR